MRESSSSRYEVVCDDALKLVVDVYDFNMLD